MHIWRDNWSELSVLLVLIAMAGGLVLTFFLRDESHDTLVRNPVLEIFDQPSVVDGIKETTDVQIEHPVHLLRQQADRERIRRIVRAAPRSEPKREVGKVGFVDGVQHLDRRALDNLVLQRGDAERS